ncbi:MAG: PIG-L family deacetylase [Chloroflexota bacterium]|nr:PIG-L family deacetylase [Chloroflexota bacterium]
MLGLALADPAEPLRSVLVVGAHADDIEIGCGGTLLRLLQVHPGIAVCWVVLSGSGIRGDEARKSAGVWLDGAAGRSVIVRDFEDGFFPYSGAGIKRFFEDLKGEIQPDLVLTHFRDDLHQDHRLVNELTWNTFRDHLILEYEVPKYDGDLGSPNFFVHLSRDICRRKVDTLLRCFPSQHSRRWFTEDLFLSLLRLRGMESNSPSHYAEAFYCRKVVATL